MIINFFIILASLTTIIGCGDKHAEVKSIGTPYQLTIEEVYIKTNKDSSLGPANRDIADMTVHKTQNETLHYRIIALPIVLEGLSVMERSGAEIRECSFKGEIKEPSERGYMLDIAYAPREKKYEGTLFIDPEHLRRLQWIDDTNRLQKDICVNSLGEDLNQHIQRRKIDSEALKKALDEIDALEGSK